MAESAFPSLQSTGPSSLRLPESLPSLEDREPQFVNASDVNRFRCALHPGLLREPQQTKCGHRSCLRCLEAYLGEAKTKPCPVGEPDCEAISRDEVWRDNSIIRDIKKAQVYCYNRREGCTVKTRFHNIKDHLEECDFEPVACVFAARECQEKVPRGKLAQHQTACPCRPERCPACKQEINHSQMKAHTDCECQEAVVGCPFGCGDKQLKRKEVEAHKNRCPVQPVDCKYKHMGCTFSGTREEVDRHEKQDLSRHLELLTVRVAKMEMTGLDLQGKIQVLSEERDNRERAVHSRGRDSQTSVQRMEDQVKELKLKMVTMLEKAFTVERKIPELVERSQLQTVERNVTRMQQRVTQLEQTSQREQQQQSSAGTIAEDLQLDVLDIRMAELGINICGDARRRHHDETFRQPQPTAGGAQRLNGGDITPQGDSVEQHLDNHDRQLGVHDTRMAEMDLRFQLLETASYDGKLIWKICDYARRKRDAVNGRTLSLYSQPFYTNRFGYKMCAHVYLNGDGMGKNTHLSLSFIVMRVEYDPLLVWPFRQKVTLTLLDQSTEKRHLTDSFQPDHNSSSFRRPTSEMNVASGCPLFVSHSVLENPINGYLRDDTLFIRIVVDDTPTSSPF